MKHGIRPGDMVVGNPDYGGWTDWYLKEYIKPGIPVKVMAVSAESTEIHIPAGRGRGSMTFWTSVFNKYTRHQKSCPMEVS